MASDVDERVPACVVQKRGTGGGRTDMDVGVVADERGDGTDFVQRAGQVTGGVGE